MKRVALSLAAFVATLGPSAQVFAGDTSDLQGLLDETVVTTASKSAETATNAPATSTTLTADDMRRYGIRTVDEAINFLSLGAFAYNPLYTPHVGARGVTIDGDRGAHVLLLVDGHSMNDVVTGGASFGRGLGVPLELIDHVEIILGPGAVLYGSGAMLGVVNVVTKRAKDYQGVHAVAESEIGISYRGGLSAATPFEIGKTAGAIVVGADYYWSEGPSFKFGPQTTGINPVTMAPWVTSRNNATPGVWGGTTHNTPFTYVPSGFVSARLGDFQLRVQASTNKFAAPYRARLIQNLADFDDPDTFALERVVRGDLAWQRAVSELVTLKARGYVDSYDVRNNTDVSEPLSCRYGRGARTCRYTGLRVAQSGGLELQSSFNWARDGRIVTLLGFDGRWRFVQARDDLYDYDTGAQARNSEGMYKQKEPLLGPYIQNTWQPAAWFALNVGARLDYDPRFDPVISPRAAVTTKPWRDGTFKVIYAEAFRAPSFEEAETYGVIRIQANVLKPETVRSVEASIEQRAGAHRVMFGGFRSWWSNMIGPHVLTSEEKDPYIISGRIDLLNAQGLVTQYRNVASIENYGFNTVYEGSAADSRFRYAVNVTGAIAQRVVDGAETRLTLAPNIYGNARASFDFQGNWPTFALAGHFFGNRIADRAWDGGFAVYPVAPPQAELRGTISGPVPHVPGLSYRFSANYIIGDRGPYVVGFRQGATVAFQSVGELVPVDKFRTTFGLQYDFMR